MRELKRNMARENMKDAGLAHINRKQVVTNDRTGRSKKTSFFGRNWKDWIHGKPSKKIVAM